MKVLIVVLACFALAYGQSPAKALENTINGLKEQMPCGFPDMGIPSLAPLKVDFFDLYHKLWIIKIYGDIKNAVISGLNDFSVDDVTMNVLTLKAGLSLGFRSINIQGNLSLQSWIVSFLKIKSSGNLNMTLENLRISVAVRFGMVDGVMKLMDFTPTVDLGKIEFKSTGFVIGKLTMKIVNSIAQKVVMNLFKDHKDALEETVQTIVMPAANDFLKDMTISDLLQLLTGPKEPSEPCIPPAA